MSIRAFLPPSFGSAALGVCLFRLRLTGVFLCLLTLMLGVESARAHVGNPHIVFEGRAGGFPVRVVVRQPDVVPGLAEISVRVLEGTPRRVTVLPMHWDAARRGAPAPDVAHLVSGSTQLYSAQLWLMTKGAYVVEVALEGDRGGSVRVPVNSIAYERKPMPALMRGITGFLGFILALGVVAIGFAGGRDSALAPGQEFGTQGRWRGIVGVMAGLLLVSIAVYGGNRWRLSEDAFHQARILFKPVEHHIETQQSSAGTELKIELTDSRIAKSRFSVIPEHQKWAHVFLIGTGTNTCLVHLHPHSDNGRRFDSTLPALSAGDYRLFADLTYDIGISETLTNQLHLDQPTASPQALTDVEDSVSHEALSGEETVGLPGGLRMKLADPRGGRAGMDVTLDVWVTDSQGRPASLQPYLRMFGHAVIQRMDGAVFSHAHPAGTLSMAAARGFAKKSGGEVAAKDADVVCGDLSAMPEAEVTALGRSGRVSFPFVFPSAGDYAVWIQVKVDGQILTGAFRRTVQ